MNKEHKYKDKDEYKDNDKDKDAERITESLTVCYIFGILVTQAFQAEPPADSEFLSLLRISEFFRFI